MKKIRVNFIFRMLLLVIAPMIVLSIVLSVVSINAQVKIANELLEEELNSVGYNIIKKLDSVNDSEYVMENGNFKKGDYDITNDIKYVDDLKKETNLFVTVFYKDTRALTSIKDKNGKRVVGTKADAAIADQVLNKGNNYYTKNVKIADVDCCAIYMPIKQEGSNEVIGMVFVGKDRTQVTIFSSIIKNITLSAAIVVVFIGVLYIFIKQVVSAIKNTKMQIDDVSKGNIVEKNLGKFENRNDEIGDILRASKNLVMSLRETVVDILHTSEELKNFADEYNKSFENAEESIKNINVAVEEIANSATVQAQESQSASEQVINMGNVIDTTTKSVQTLFDSSEKMINCNKSVANTLTELENIGKKTKESVYVVNNQTNMTNNSANKIRVATEMITDIANQTNLLSLNASIEAARAGEAGKGFAVVAEQIRVLSEGSKESADKIKAIVEDLIANSNSSVQTMNSMQNIMNENNEKLNMTKEVFAQLKSEVNSVTNEINSIVAQMDSLAELKNNVLKNVESLAATAQENAASTEETSATMDEVNEIITECAKSVKQLIELSLKLNENSSKFKFQ